MTAEKHGDQVKRRILEMGLTLWRVDPSYVTARRIGHELGMTHSAVLYHFKHSHAMRDAIAYHAVKEGEPRVMASLILEKHKAVAHLSEAQRLEIMRSI